MFTIGDAFLARLIAKHIPDFKKPQTHARTTEEKFASFSFQYIFFYQIKMRLPIFSVYIRTCCEESVSYAGADIEDGGRLGGLLALAQQTEIE